MRLAAKILKFRYLDRMSWYLQLKVKISQPFNPHLFQSSRTRDLMAKLFSQSKTQKNALPNMQSLFVQKAAVGLLTVAALGAVTIGVNGFVDAKPIHTTGLQAGFTMGPMSNASAPLTSEILGSPAGPFQTPVTPSAAGLIANPLLQVETSAEPLNFAAEAPSILQPADDIGAPPHISASHDTLAAQLAQLARSTELADGGQSSLTVTTDVKTKLQDVIINAGQTPFDVRSALQSILLYCATPTGAPSNTDKDPPLTCPQSAASIDAISSLLKVVVAAIDQQDAPAANGIARFAAFSSATPPPQATGGSNYQSF